MILIDFLGIGVVFWSIGRIFHHISLVKEDSGSNGKLFLTLAVIFYVLGNFSSLLIGVVDGMCHKRLYCNHLSEMQDLKAYFLLPALRKENLDDYCKKHGIGEFDSLAPLDIPESWYSLHS
ncbi:hypothetical protein [Oscillibacter sp.]|uniref:hypothetical protein n=1 Tax=Oscillibacter sp. TaxID=1945593 RepID=UPI00289C8426|nr:hypothetical protein [Oscillibacter sp.]